MKVDQTRELVQLYVDEKKKVYVVQDAIASRNDKGSEYYRR